MDASEKQEITSLVRDAVGEAVAPLVGRVERLEGKVDRLDGDVLAVREDVAEIRERTKALADADVKFADQITKVSSAAAHAAEIGLKAMTRASENEDATTKIVQSAMTIHNASIAATVEATVAKIAGPIASEVAALKTNDVAQNETLREQNATLAAQNETLADIKKMVGKVLQPFVHPLTRRVIIAAAIIGALVGGAVAGYVTATGGQAAKKTLAP
jgi:hypothetical protein